MPRTPAKRAPVTLSDDDRAEDASARYMEENPRVPGGSYETDRGYGEDADFDGVDDVTGNRTGETAEQIQYRRNVNTLENAFRNGEITQEEYEDITARGYNDRTVLDEWRQGYDADRAAEQAASDARDVANRQSDLDAGRRPGSGATTDFGAGASSGRASDFDEASADIWLWGDLTGARGRRDAARAMSAEERNRATWQDLQNYAPTPDDLAVDYEEEKYIGGPERSELGAAQADPAAIEAQRIALAQMQEVARGGITAADRARLQMGEQEVGRVMRSQREADRAALEARGMGGSGAELASTLSAQQGGAQAMSQRDLQMQIEAQQRALQAMQMSAGMGGQMRDQSFGEASTRGSAQDEFNYRETDYSRGLEGRNTGLRNQSRESRSGARQQAYENRERMTAGQTNQYQGDQQRRQQEGAASQAATSQTVGAIGRLLENL